LNSPDCDTTNNKGEKLICEKTDKHTWWCDGPKHKWGNTLQNAASKACECKKTPQSDIASKGKNTTEQIGSQ
jgi:L,D-peptidoglycan transpeptidase YkuD (ErfK/YbiS/YcfS/YnhG family)